MMLFYFSKHQPEGTTIMASKTDFCLFSTAGRTENTHTCKIKHTHRQMCAAFKHTHTLTHIQAVAKLKTCIASKMNVVKTELLLHRTTSCSETRWHGFISLTTRKVRTSLLHQPPFIFVHVESYILNQIWLHEK